MDILLSEVKEVAQNLALNLKGGEVIALNGQLGSGKTTFTQHLGKALGVVSQITSPTFVLMQEYPVSKHPTIKWLYHLDLYRLSDFTELKALDIEQIWQQPQTITIIEWADKFAEHLPTNTLTYNLKRDEEI
ncbi:MAG: tRNA (adenosine(37)-N6)-threonylcarbamoyltransferase complex ATPase subunit type 1 TsaE [Candidatus Doudnabacteria bacterium]